MVALVSAVANGVAPEFFGSGRQTRDFVFVEDVVDAYVRAVAKGDGLVINVGTGVQTSISSLWKMIGAKSVSGPIIGSARPSDISRFAVSPVRARIHLAWNPFTSLEDGLAAFELP